jgi:hypothetical protein
MLKFLDGQALELTVVELSSESSIPAFGQSSIDVTTTQEKFQISK